MNILLVSPPISPDIYSYKYVLKLLSIKSLNPPMGLLTVASLLPNDWEKKLVDMNFELLNDTDIKWADYVFISAMGTQDNYLNKIVSRCKNLGTKTVAGGPLVTLFPDEYPEIDHLILNEAEITLPQFLRDMQNGSLKRKYSSDQFADIQKTPAPLWDLIDIKNYYQLSIQFSRGCPYACDFCNVSEIYGRKMRNKTIQQILDEMDKIYSRGWRGEVFFVDDNFIGNSAALKREILPGIINWMKEHHFPFAFHAQASLNIADDSELIALMVRSNFRSVFVGIETVNEASLTECSKVSNMNRDLLKTVQKIQSSGLQVYGGFIVGFDNDSETVFDQQINFIQQSGIVPAMVNLLKALPGTRLFSRLKKENRLISEVVGGPPWITNVIPKMGNEKLLAGYKKLVFTIYSPSNLCIRIKQYLTDSMHGGVTPWKMRSLLSQFIIGTKVLFVFGVLSKDRLHYLKLLFWTLFNCPKYFQNALAMLVTGQNMIEIFNENLR